MSDVRPSRASRGVAWSSQLRSLAARFGATTAVTDGAGNALSYATLCARAHALAVRLASMGIAPGEPVATLLANGLDAVWVSHGVALSGAADTPLNWNCTEAEIDWCAKLARFRLVITNERRVTALAARGLEALETASVGNADPGLELAPCPGEAWGRILFTSGTTGRPKGIVHSHERRWLAHTMLKAALPFVPEPGDRILLMTPFPHGASLLAWAWLDFGGEVVLLEGVDPARVGALLESGTLTALFAPPTVIAKLSATLGERRFEGIRCLFTGTQALSPATYRKARAMFGPVVRITYGKSECTNPITVFPPLETERHFAQQAAGPGACVGWPVAGVEISIREGEVWLRAPHMYVGHLDESGFHALGEAEWHRTGDLGRVDEAGRLWLEARVADVIKSGGYKVLPDEIEALLAGVRGCGEICVTSLPSAYWGEVVVAVAEGASGAWQTEAAARLHALSRYKHPRVFVAVDALPRNAQGKVSRRELRQRLLARHELIDGPHPRLLERTLAGMPGTA